MSGRSLVVAITILGGFVLLLRDRWMDSTFILPGISFKGPPNISQFEVHGLPGSPPLPRSWAGRIPIPCVPDGNALFFWLFEAEDTAHDDNLIIWFNGGPGCSSLLGMTGGSGPVSFIGNSTQLVSNPYSWSKLGHLLFVDQPAGTGLSTASVPYPVSDNSRVTSDFYAWLRSFFAHFPHLMSKRVHMIGESYAGIYIPYFARQIIRDNATLPINLQSVSIGDGAWGNGAAMAAVSIGTYIKMYRRELEAPADVVDAFSEADGKCGFAAVMREATEYPPRGKIYVPGNPENMNFRPKRDRMDDGHSGGHDHDSNGIKRQRRDLESDLDAFETCAFHPTTANQVLASIFNPSCYRSCATFSASLDYFTTAADSHTGKPCFDVYNIQHTCNAISPLPLLAAYFSRADVQAALNTLASSSSASTDGAGPVPFMACNTTIPSILLAGDVAAPIEPPAYTILPELITTHNVSVHIYSGEYDMLINYLGTELSLQNMTWGGAQGFSKKPSRVFYANDAAPKISHPDSVSAEPARSSSPRARAARKRSWSRSQPAPGVEIQHEQGTEAVGIWASERGLTYHLFWGAGHTVVADKPKEMFAYVRDVVLVG